jgi:hypothetical protein
VTERTTVGDLLGHDAARFHTGLEIPSVALEQELSMPSWSKFSTDTFDCLLYSGPSGARCWKLHRDGSMVEVTKEVVPVELTYEPDPTALKVGEVVRLNEGANRLPLQIRSRYRPGDQATVAKVMGRTHLMINVAGKGEIKVARSWVDRVRA